MIVFHAIWDSVVSGKLHLWAESSSMPVVVHKRGGRQAAQAQTHPFTLPYKALREALGEITGSLLVQSADLDALTLRLPTTAKGPQSSPELIREQEDVGQDIIGFKAWDVETLTFAPGAALDFLLSLPDNAPRGIVSGSSLRFWSMAARFAAELIVGQAYMPALQEIKQNRMVMYRAEWQAVLSDDDSERMVQLAQLMPPVCWSYLPLSDKTASLLHEMVLHFLNATVDAFVRDSLSVKDLLPAQSRQGAKPPTLLEQWLSALTTEDGAMSGTAKELRVFAQMLQTWLGQLSLKEADSSFRTCFRLDPPLEENTENKDWHISFHLQAKDDRSLLVPAEQVWRERSGTLTFLKRKFENPQERLLADLGKASRLFPAVEDSLKTAHPSELTLDTEQAYQFLRQSAPLLEQSGFGVLVPPWWNKASAKPRVKLKIKAQGDVANRGLLSLDGIVAYDWNIAIGDTILSAQEFEELVSLKMPLIQVRGQWVELRPAEIEAAITFFKKKQGNGTMTFGEALRLGLGQDTAEVGLPVDGIEGDGWMQGILDKLSGNTRLTPIKTPPTFQGKLRPYQVKGVSWLAFLQQFGFGSCLADDMGLGKTVQLITLLLLDAVKSPCLIICPMSIVGNWHRELQRFAPSLSVMIHHGAERLSGPAFAEEVRKHDVVITTYALALRDKKHLSHIDWQYLVVDEAQNIKNEEAKQTLAIKSIPAVHKIALTGTPVENRLSELWSIMEFLNPGYLGSGTDFRKHFAIPIERYHNAPKAESLKHLIQPFVLRRVKTDKTIIQDLPDKMEMKVYCNLTQEQASLYEAVVKEMLEKIEEAVGIERRGLILATLMKLKQVCNHPAQFIGDGSSLSGRSGKLARLEEMLEEVLAEGDKALIFTQFAEMGKLLRNYLQESLGREVLFLHGGTPKKERDAMVQRFQEDRHGPPIFILSLKAGGVGLNLTGANHVFHFDRWWNPAVENQATDRAFRIGQQKNVQVYKYVSVGTLEERIDQMIEDKKALAENIVGSGENWLTEMSTSQLKELFALSREAVGV
ncbi:MAG TPA: DEAD/DEAH box helicase [Ktedonobacteraceae bacterium]|nr:DEAD/DEAH box helicase [Ktedonobacteraceae bacterium]